MPFFLSHSFQCAYERRKLIRPQTPKIKRFSKSDSIHLTHLVDFQIPIAQRPETQHQLLSTAAFTNVVFGDRPKRTGETVRERLCP